MTDIFGDKVLDMNAREVLPWPKGNCYECGCVIEENDLFGRDVHGYLICTECLPFYLDFAAWLENRK